MRVLITGAAGFVGQHLSRLIIADNDDIELHGTVYSENEFPPQDGIGYHAIDLCDPDATTALMHKLQPQEIYHLAAMASTSESFEHPWRTFEANSRIQMNLLEACKTLTEKPRFLVASSAVVYGPTKPHEQPITEAAPFRPTNAYSLSKITQDMMALQYFYSDGIPTIRARAFNHLGPGQRTSFVAPDFAYQIAKIEMKKQAPVMRVGNLSAARDFTDVRDVARAYMALMKHGEAGTAYNIASNNTYTIQTLLDTLLAFTNTDINVTVDADRLRPVDVSEVRGDYSRLHAHTNWEPLIPFEQSLRELLEDCRQRVQQL